MPKNSIAAVFNRENPRNLGPQWFALRVRSRREKAVAAIVRNKGFEDFLPAYISRHRWSDRIKTLERPLFPGYVFCRLEPDRRLPLLTIPGVLHMVGVGKVPAPLEDHEIAAIQSIIHSGLTVEPWPFLEIGQRIRLEAGPLAGLEGITIGTAKDQRVIASLSLLRRSVAVSIEHHWAAALPQDQRQLHSLQSAPRSCRAHPASDTTAPKSEA